MTDLYSQILGFPPEQTTVFGIFLAPTASFRHCNSETDAEVLRNRELMTFSSAILWSRSTADTSQECHPGYRPRNTFGIPDSASHDHCPLWRRPKP